MLTIDGINVAYGKVQVLHDLSLNVKENEIVTIIGSNGAGKTTTLNAIMGALKPTKGRIEFLGKRMDQLDSNKIVASGISIVPEGRRVFPDFSVYENLLTGACVRRMHASADFIKPPMVPSIGKTDIASIIAFPWIAASS